MAASCVAIVVAMGEDGLGGTNTSPPGDRKGAPRTQEKTRTQEAPVREGSIGGWRCELLRARLCRAFS